MQRLITRSLQRYWRISRGLTLGAQACVIKDAAEVLLIRHTYRPGWHFPGGGVEKGEALEMALAREVAEETGIILVGRPALFGIYDNARFFPGDHVALYVVRSWRQPIVPQPNREIAEQRFFRREALPDGIHASTALRIEEVFEGRMPAEVW
ncbi:MAG: NUDIX domain-containing protein [Hyphomicrobium sp.]